MEVVAVILLVAAQALLLACLAAVHSPTADEIAYLPGGIAHWRFGRFELARANPPLVRITAALPVLAAGCETDWSRYDGTPGERPDFIVGKDFLVANGSRSFRLFTMARWACIPFVVAGGLICWLWARELYGRWAGLASLALWCFCPNILGNGALITPDAATSSLGVASAFTFWRWLRAANLGTAYVAGLALGLAELAKTNWLFLFPLWPLLWAVWRFAPWKAEARGRLAQELAQFGVIFALAIIVINVGYGFDGTCKPLGEFDFASVTLRGTDQLADDPRRELGNRFRGSWLGALPVPLPEQYVLGIDIQRRSVEKGRPAYLFGRWKHGGWWYYYLAAATLKVPVGTWLLLALAATTRLRGVSFGTTWLNEFVLLAPTVATLIFISSQTGINRHFRYALPVLPFLFVWVSSLAQLWTHGPMILAWLASGAWMWAIASSMLVYPHSLSYFNELAGGPRGGPRFLHGSNTDWGQDLLFLKKWIDDHPGARPLTVGWHMTNLDTKLAGIDCLKPPRIPTPGWHVISVNEIYGYETTYRYFQDFKPVGSVGYTMNVYHMTEAEVDRWQTNRQR